jgi:RimJ/RimL family protein N-acetyltransferase
MRVHAKPRVNMPVQPNAETPFPRPLSRAPVAQLPSAQIPARSPIEGRYVLLEPLDAERHGAELYRASHADAMAATNWDFLPFGPYSSQSAYIETLRQQTAQLEQIYFAARAKTSTGIAEAVGGQTSFLDIHPQQGVIEIGSIWFGFALRKTRAATEALYLMLRHAMHDLRYRRMQLRCNSLNLASRTAARRLGFRFEGVFYNHMITKMNNRDTAWYSILDDEWPEFRAILETWLAPGNFDADGKANTSLSEMMQQRSLSVRELD